MANAAKLVANFRRINKEVRERFAEQDESRSRAQNILSPDRISEGVDAGHLYTKLGMMPGNGVRRLTVDDLKVFKNSAEALGKKFKGGITPKHIVDMSTQDRRDRARQQIHMAVPVRRMHDRVHFVTNAGPDSKVTRHHVQVQFLTYGSAIASPSKPADLVRLLAAGHVKFDCDCDDHRYVYRYMATIGQYNAGRDETGFPKLRNPHLDGIACKHMLRVANVLSSPGVRQYLTKMIEDGRRDSRPKNVALKASDVRELAAQQQATAHHKRSQIETTEEKRDRLAAQRAIKKLSEKSLARGKALSPKQKPAERRRHEKDARSLAAAGLITAKKLASILAKLAGK